MSNAAHLLEPEIRAAAEALAYLRAARQGAPGLPGLLDCLPEPLFIELVEDARAAVVAHALAVMEARGETPPVPRRRGPLNPADAAALRLDLDVGSLLILVRDRNGLARSALSAVSAEPVLYGHEVAQALWSAVARVLIAHAPDGPHPFHPVPQPEEQRP